MAAEMTWAYNVSDMNMTTSDGAEINQAPDQYQQAEWIMKQVVSPILCAFGITGNILNVLVLSRRQMKASSDNKMESTACLGLIVLAISDLLYCFFTILGAFNKEKMLFSSKSFWLYYFLYSPYVRNSLSYTSTWLTVLMAVSRYMAICHPLHARIFVIPGGTKLSIVIITLVWFSLTLPEAFDFAISPIDAGNMTYYIVVDGPMKNNQTLRDVFTYLWSVIGFIIPVSILAFCNARLIQALRESQKMRREYRVHQRTQQPGSKITLTLIAIVMMFLILVSPSEILNIVQFVTGSNPALALAIDIANVLHTLNFSVNFVLYCVVNVHFRSTLHDMFCYICLKKKKEKCYLQASSTTLYSHVPMRSSVVNHHNETVL